jgi:uncharacterized protein (TIGR02266 family)
VPKKKLISTEFPVKEQLLRQFEWRERQPVLFMPSDQRIELGEKVKLVVKFPTEERIFWLNGTVIGRRVASSGIPPLPAGIEIEIERDMHRSLQMLLDHAGGKQVYRKERQNQRLACSFVVTYRQDKDFIQEFTADLGEGGTFIRTENFLPEDTEVECRLKPPGHMLGIKLKGRVAWVRDRGQPKGMGIEFMFVNPRKRKKLRDLVEKLVAEREDDEVDPGVQRKEKARQKAREGENALDDKRHRDALRLFEEAIRLDPDVPAYHFKLGVVAYQRAMEITPKDEKLPAAILRPFLKAVALDTYYDQPRVYLGMIAKRNGEYERALKEYRGALACNPENKTALIEVRVLEKRLGSE